VGVGDDQLDPVSPRAVGVAFGGRAVTLHRFVASSPGCFQGGGCQAAQPNDERLIGVDLRVELLTAM
jgi:hypothetical protein